MNKVGGAAALLLAVLVATPAVAQQTFYCESTEGRGHARIVGGQQTSVDNWPWQVMLVLETPYGRSAGCGGSIISPRWILTAAHCLFSSTSVQVFDEVGLGELYTDHHGFGFSVVYGEDRPRGKSGVPADRVIPHEAYDPRGSDNDIALIRLTENIPGHRSVQLSSEKLDRVFARPGLCATVTGWGTTEAGGATSDTLQRADMPILTTSACAEAYPDESTRHTICAGYDQGGVDSCQGDSGGPFVVRHGTSSRYVQVGVVSWGYGCAQPGRPGVYTRVSKYIDWIQSHTGR